MAEAAVVGIAEQSHRTPDFRRYWLAGAANMLGSHATSLVLPLLVLSLGGTPLTAGVLGTTAAVGQVLLEPVAGVYADRWPRRLLLLVSATVAGAAMAAIGLAVVLDRASLALLFPAAVLEGLASAVYAAASAGALPSVLPAADPERALGSLRSREQAANLVGPSVGGGLYQAAAWAPFLADAVSYAAVVGLIRSIRTDLGPRPSPSDSAPPSFRAEFTAGLRFLWGQPFLRFVALWAGGVNLLLAALYFHVVLESRLHGASASSIGLILTVAGAGGLIGSLLAGRLLRWVAPRTLVVAVSWALVGIVALLALTTRPWDYGLLLALVYLVSPAISIVLQAKAIASIPDRLQARVGTALGTLSEGCAAVAPLLAGAMVGLLSPATIAVLFAAALALLAWYATANSGHLRPSTSDAAAAGLED